MVNFEAYFSGTYLLFVSVGRSVSSAGGGGAACGGGVPCGCPAGSDIILYS